jgi:DDE family transposase
LAATDAGKAIAAIMATRRLTSSAANAVRLQLHALAYNLGNFLRTLATPEPIKEWSLTSLKEKLIKIGAKVVSHGRYIDFQMAEVAIPQQMFREILRLIAELRPQPPPAPARAAQHGRAFKRSRREERVQMPRKMARFAARPPFGLSEVRVAVGTPRLSCREARKAPIFTSVREPSGESRFNFAECEVAHTPSRFPL